MLDLAIRGGEVVDGTGAPRRRADVGINDGRIVQLGAVDEAREDIDASGLLVSPGFIDVHSHVDAQVFWDPALTPYCLHGTTSTFAGNCGFTLAPWDDSSADYLVRMLSVVEGMPLEALQAGVPGDWRSTDEYLRRIDGTAAINVGFMVGHSALRRVVMGEECLDRAATSDEVAAMQRLLADGLAAGGLGFSSSWGIAHYDAEGKPVPSRAANRDEIVALAGVCRSFDGTSLEFIPNGIHPFNDDELELLTAMSHDAGRPLNWNVLRITAQNGDHVAGMLRAGPHARERDARIVALNMPIPTRARFTFRTGFALDFLPDWKPLFELPHDERLRALRDPAMRHKLDAGAKRATGQLADNGEWGARIITQTFREDLKRYEGRVVADIAAEEGKDVFDALLDIVCADNLDTTFSRIPVPPSTADWQAAVDAWRSGHALIGASDAGAHLDFTVNYDYQVFILQHAVRELGILGVEEAVHLMTDVPARLYGLRDRGCISEGAFADVVLFDESTVGCGHIETRHDLPAGAARLYTEPVGIARVLVNGRTIVDDGKATGEHPGRVLRSGIDTYTAPLAP